MAEEVFGDWIVDIEFVEADKKGPDRWRAVITENSHINRSPFPIVLDYQKSDQDARRAALLKLQEFIRNEKDRLREMQAAVLDAVKYNCGA